MKKFIICSLMACAAMVASASSYEPPKVGMDVPDIGYSVPSVTAVETAMVVFDYQMLPECGIVYLSPVATAQPIVASVACMSRESVCEVSAAKSGYLMVKLKVPPLTGSPISAYNPVTFSNYGCSKFPDSHYFRLRWYEAANYAACKGFTHTRYVYKV